MSVRLHVWLCFWLTLLPYSCAVAEFTDYGFTIIRAALKPDKAENSLSLDADIDYRFSEPAIDALRNGVSLTLVLHLNIQRERDAWWNEDLLDEKQAYRIRYHALSKQYQILDGDDEAPRNFTSLNALLEAMGMVRGLPITQAVVLVPGERYRARLSVRLDIEALPLPLRPVAYLTPAWYLNSVAYSWTFAN
jgi:hypothetical protein